MANMTAASGLPKMAAMPEQAPAARIIFRSAEEICMSWPVREPNAPPVAMMGPSAPKGPPVPIEIAADRGFRNVMAGGIRLSSMIIFSMASGIPCPVMDREPNRAISPTRKLPAIGIKITDHPRLFTEGEEEAKENFQLKERLVIQLIRYTSPFAIKPMQTAFKIACRLR